MLRARSLVGAGRRETFQPSSGLELGVVRRAGIREVAKAAEVSVGTVSNVLNRPEQVRLETRTRVQAAIAALGFVRNESARQLRAGRSRAMAYITLDLANPFFADVGRGMEEVARERGFALFVCSSQSDAAREVGYLELLLEQGVLGILVTSVDYGGEKLNRLPLEGLPVVFVDHFASDADWCSVGVDDVEGGDLAVAHLLELGHTSIAFVGGPTTTPQVADRLTGARRAIEAAGHERQLLTVLETSSQTVTEGKRAGERLLGLPSRRRPTAVFAANDLLAIGLLQEMVQAGIRVPENLAIVGYDDIEFAAAASVPLSSVAQPRQRLGRAAAELLLDEVDNPRHRHRRVEFMPELIVRASSGTSPRTSLRSAAAS